MASTGGRYQIVEHYSAAGQGGNESEMTRSKNEIFRIWVQGEQQEAKFPTLGGH